MAKIGARPGPSVSVCSYRTRETIRGPIVNPIERSPIAVSLTLTARTTSSSSGSLFVVTGVWENRVRETRGSCACTPAAGNRHAATMRESAKDARRARWMLMPAASS